MALWQRGSSSDATLKQQKATSRHTLKVSDTLLKCYPSKLKPGKCERICSSTHGRHSLPNKNSDCVRQSNATDMAFILRRQSSDVKERWTAFNQLVSSQNPEQISVGYLPIILSPAHEMGTLNTVVRRCLVTAEHFQQEHVAITVDQALFCKLMELKWGVTEYMDKFFPKFGGLHIAINFLKVIGDHMNGSGLEEIWVESGLLDPRTIKKVLSGKA